MIKKLNDVVTYIEAHLDESISIADLADIIGLPEYHLTKVFFALAGVSIYEYIKLRRLSNAASALLKGTSITDAAFDAGYTSIDGFTRAFKAWCGYLPSVLKKEQIYVSYSRISFSIQVEGGHHMEYRITDYPQLRFVGVSKRIALQFEGVNQEIVALAQSISQEQREALHHHKTMEPKQILSISWDSDTSFMAEDGKCSHMIGVMTQDREIADCLEVIEVPALTWAVFTAKGPFPQTLQQTYADIYAKWLPTVDYTLVNAPNFSFSIDGDGNDKESEIWVAVQPK